MNVALFLTPKSEVQCVSARVTVRQAADHLERHGYTAVPILDDEQRYVGTLTEGDLLRAIRADPSVDVESTRVSRVPRRLENRAVDVTAEIAELVQLAVHQNFVPVVDSRGVLMGIVTRRSILTWLRSQAGLGGG
ncbi:MAG: CBS domain-containing protein [Myxococcota bacterium]